MIREKNWSKKLHWTTTASEKILLGVIGTLTMVAAGLDVYKMIMVHFKIELADLTAAAHISCIDYLGDMPWEKFPEIKHWYSRIKSRPSFRSILTDKIIGIPPRGNYALLDF